MRHFLFVSGVLVAGNLLAVAAEPQKSSTAQDGMARAAGLVSPQPSPSAAEIMAARADADRYYFQYGRWWYYTPQNTWLRWDGTAWQPYTPQPAAQQPPPAIVEPVTNRTIYEIERAPGPSYRYSINRTVGGL